MTFDDTRRTLTNIIRWPYWKECWGLTRISLSEMISTNRLINSKLRRWTIWTDKVSGFTDVFTMSLKFRQRKFAEGGLIEIKRENKSLISHQIIVVGCFGWRFSFRFQLFGLLACLLVVRKNQRLVVLIVNEHLLPALLRSLVDLVEVRRELAGDRFLRYFTG